MPMTRRKAIAMIGGGVVLAATGAIAGFAGTRTPGRALAPWAAAGQYTDPRKRAVSHALLAPNPHNLQPWLIELSDGDELTLHRDPTKVLEHTDPFDRQITIGLGCFLEQMVIAASADGYAVDMNIFPDGEEGPIAHAVFRRGAAPDPLAAQIVNRRSCKEPYAEKTVPVETAQQLSRYAKIITDTSQVEDIRDLTWKAHLVEMHTPRTLMESVDVMRMGKSQINANPDGIAIGGPFLEGLMLAGLMTREGLADPESAAFKQGLDMFRAMYFATPAFAVITTAGNTRTDQIEAGRRWLRLNLETTRLHMALHPVSQSLQEYPEMSELYARAHATLAEPGETVQMLGRLGYGPMTGPSPRWPLEKKLLNG